MGPRFQMGSGCENLNVRASSYDRRHDDVCFARRRSFFAASSSSELVCGERFGAMAAIAGGGVAAKAFLAMSWDCYAICALDDR